MTARPAFCELPCGQPERPDMSGHGQVGCGGLLSGFQPSLYAAEPHAAATRRQAAHSGTSISALPAYSAALLVAT